MPICIHNCVYLCMYTQILGICEHFLKQRNRTAWTQILFQLTLRIFLLMVPKKSRIFKYTTWMWTAGCQKHHHVRPQQNASLKNKKKQKVHFKLNKQRLLQIIWRTKGINRICNTTEEWDSIWPGTWSTNWWTPTTTSRHAGFCGAWAATRIFPCSHGFLNWNNLKQEHSGLQSKALKGNRILNKHPSRGAACH